MDTQNSQTQEIVSANIKAHDKIAKSYESLHGEIFNDTEQARLREALKSATDKVDRRQGKISCLDFGCGSGNISKHLLELGMEVTAADVSIGFLDLVKSRYKNTQLRTLHLPNGETSHIQDNTFDLIAAYSVLHHIPDYLALCREFGRICRPGGVIYIDHEASEEFWNQDLIYKEFQKNALRINWRKYLTPSNYIHRLRKIVNPRHSSEGDIHVWPDDHIEWGRIVETMEAMSFKVIREESYLLFRRLYKSEVYDKYVDRCRDTKLMVFKKVEN